MFSHSTTIGDATNTDEYVPTTIPTINANAKSRRVSPPARKRTMTTDNVVSEVIRVRPSTSLIEVLIVAMKSPLRRNVLRFSLILSNTTTESDKEYPARVRSATTTSSVIALWRIQNIHSTASTSWNVAIVAATPNLRSNLIQIYSRIPQIARPIIQIALRSSSRPIDGPTS